MDQALWFSTEAEYLCMFLIITGFGAFCGSPKFCASIKLKYVEVTWAYCLNLSVTCDLEFNASPLCRKTPNPTPFHIPRASTCVGTAIIQLIKLRCHIWNWLAVETETGVFKVWNPFSRRASPGTIPCPHPRLPPPPPKEMWFHMCSRYYLPLSLGFMMTLEVNLLFFPSPCSPLPCTFNPYWNVYERWSVAPKWERQPAPSCCILQLKQRWSLPAPFCHQQLNCSFVSEWSALGLIALLFDDRVLFGQSAWEGITHRIRIPAYCAIFPSACNE